jgi:hypothetical protein
VNSRLRGVLGLKDRVAAAEATAFLLLAVQTETQAGGVDPPITHLGQSPYRRGLRQGVCDLSQGLGVGNAGEAVAFLGETDSGHLCLGGDVLVAVEDDLRAERGMPGHLDREMPPFWIHDVKRVVVDEGPFPGQVADDTASRAGDVPDRCHDARHEDQEHPSPEKCLLDTTRYVLRQAIPLLATNNPFSLPTPLLTHHPTKTDSQQAQTKTPPSTGILPMVTDP